MSRNLLMTALVIVSSLAACSDRKAPAEEAPSKTAESPVVQSQEGKPPVMRASSDAQPAAAPFDPASVPETNKALPPFPYIDWPQGVHEAFRATFKQEEFDVGYVVTGKTLRRVEGRVEMRRFTLRESGLSTLAAMRNYQNAMTELGAVRIPGDNPRDEAFVAANGGDAYELNNKKLYMPDLEYQYAAYLLRTPDTNVWFNIGVSDKTAVIGVIEEKAMKQKVGFVKAEAMKSELDQKGRIALYINFDTDRATVRDDGKAIVDEIGKLMKDNPALKVSIEGHTDNTGDARHNKELSEKRAASVLTAVVATGIDKARLQSAGFGAEKPLADNGTDDGRARNRRVELVKQ